MNFEFKMSDKDPMNTCEICIEAFTRINKLIPCPCDYKCCSKCTTRYILSQNQDASCMNCKMIWDRQFMTSHFTKSFMAKEFKEHRENIVLERELGMMQATQPDVESVIRKRKIKLEIEDLTRNKNESFILKHELEKSIKSQHETSSTKHELKLSLDLLREIKKSINVMINQIYNLKVRYATTDPVKPKEFIRKCPVEDCKGFLSKSLKCGICDTFSCKDCREVVGKTTIERDSHTCDINILENVKCMIKEAKPCPKCASMISKIDGCDQMFCIQCQTAFSWKTLHIETGIIHNPHYLEMLRKGGIQIERNPGDIQCGRELDRRMIENIIYHSHDRFQNNGMRTIENVIRKVIEFSHYDTFQFRINILDANKDLRIQYMMNELSKDKFKVMAQRRDKASQKNTELYSLSMTYVSIITDILYRFMANDVVPKTKQGKTEEEWGIIKKQKKDLIQCVIKEVLCIREYTNEEYQRISKIYNCVCYHVGDDFRIHTL